MFDPTQFDQNEGAPTPVRQFFPFDDHMRGGVDVALGRVRPADAPGLEAALDLIVGAGRSGQSRVEVLQASDGARVASFETYGDEHSR